MNQASTARAFIAFEIPDAVRASLDAARDRVRDTLPPARWTRPAAWHLTVKFFGEANRDALEQLAADLRPCLSGRGVVNGDLVGGGFFPSPVKPRVAWIGGSLAGAGPVVDEVEAAAIGAGFPAEGRPWTAHLTMARLKSRWPRGAVDAYLEWAAALVDLTFVCREVVLFESRLQPGGAVYTALERIPLE